MMKRKTVAYSAKSIAISVVIIFCVILVSALMPPRVLRLQKLRQDPEVGYRTSFGQSQLEAEWFLWRQRDKRDISRDLLRYVKAKDEDVRLFAVRALAKLETPLADNISCVFVQSPVKNIYLNIALGRIRTRKLTGQVRLEAISKSQGVPWSELVEKSEIINGNWRRKSGFFGRRVMAENSFSDHQNTVEALIIEEIVDVLYGMRRQGKSLKGLANDLTFNESQRLRLQGASLSYKQETEFLLNYLVSQKVITGAKERIPDYLAMMPQPEFNLVLARKKEAKTRQLYGSNAGYKSLLRVRKCPDFF